MRLVRPALSLAALLVGHPLLDTPETRDALAGIRCSTRPASSSRRPQASGVRRNSRAPAAVRPAHGATDMAGTGRNARPDSP